tara:strand:- start:775 stop:1143 length:369 start_codon:yes stop_codon:yes gene_type:complete
MLLKEKLLKLCEKEVELAVDIGILNEAIALLGSTTSAQCSGAVWKKLSEIEHEHYKTVVEITYLDDRYTVSTGWSVVGEFKPRRKEIIVEKSRYICPELLGLDDFSYELDDSLAKKLGVLYV